VIDQAKIEEWEKTCPDMEPGKVTVEWLTGTVEERTEELCRIWSIAVPALLAERAELLVLLGEVRDAMDGVESPMPFMGGGDEALRGVDEYERVQKKVAAALRGTP
jgi:hypothetical protein